MIDRNLSTCNSVTQCNEFTYLMDRGEFKSDDKITLAYLFVPKPDIERLDRLWVSMKTVYCIGVIATLVKDSTINPIDT